MKNMKEILEKISAEHPYKVSGDWDSYSQYNGAWQDCIARIEQEMDLMQQKNRFEFNFSGVKAFDCQCGRRYVNTDGWIPVEERLPEEPKENPVFDGKELELYLVDIGDNYPLRAFWNGQKFTDGWSVLNVKA